MYHCLSVCLLSMQNNMEQSRNGQGSLVGVTFNVECPKHIGFDNT